MNLSDYFDPVDFKKLTSGPLSLGKYGLHNDIKFFRNNYSDKYLENSDLVLIGVPSAKILEQNSVHSPDSIRKNLYKLASLDNSIRIADLGNIKKSKSVRGVYLALRDIIEYLHEKKIITVVLGGNQDLTIGICNAFKDEKYFWLSIVDAVLDVKKGTEKLNSRNYLTQLLKKSTQLFQFSLIAHQNHLIGNRLLITIQDKGEHLRLGELRNDITKAEVVLRNTHALSFDMNALKGGQTDIPGIQRPNGLSYEEACQLAHYAGLSTKLSVFGLFETLAEWEDQDSSVVAGEILWYFLNAVSHRTSPSTRTVYKVEVEGMNQPIIFKHEKALNRWWYEIKSVSGEIVDIACSETEYEQAASNEIPVRWLRLLQKMDNMPK